MRTTEHSEVISGRLMKLHRVSILAPVVDQFGPFLITSKPSIDGRDKHVDNLKKRSPPATDLAIS